MSTTLNGPSELFVDTASPRTSRIPVDLSTGSPVTVRLVIVPALAGDQLRISAELDMTNDVGRDPSKGLTRYTVGIGWMLWLYDGNAPADVRAATWRLIGSARGMNVTPDLHHLAVDIQRRYTIPDDWEIGHSAVAVLRVDAHSTAWNANGGGEAITVENHGFLEVERWRTPTP